MSSPPSVSTEEPQSLAYADKRLPARPFVRLFRPLPAARRVKPRPARQGRGLRWGICALFAAMVTLAILQFSFRHGRLIVFPGYDDCGYFADGAIRLQTFYDWGFGGVCSEYLHRTPHSPFESVMAVLAFTLFGYHDWAPYVMNSLLALGYFLLADRLLKGVALWQKIICFTFIAGIPFVGMAVHEFRPDHAVALFTAAGVFVLLVGPFIYGSRRRQFAAGLLLGLAMLTKPPVFPQTLMIGFAALALATLSDALASGRLPAPRAALRAWLTVLAPFLLLPLPHYLYDHAHILGYIQDILVGHHKAAYEKHGTLAYHLRYYLSGEGGQIMLGAHYYILLALLGACGVGLAVMRRRADAVRAAALLAMVLLAYAIPTANKTKQQFFGLLFDTLLAFGVVMVLGKMLVAERRRGGWMRLATLVLVVAAIEGTYWFQWPTRYGNVNAGWEQNRRDIVYGIFDTMVRHSTFGGADVAPAPDTSIPESDKSPAPTPMLVLCGVGDVNDQVLTYLAVKNEISMNVWFNNAAQTPADMIRDFDGADFILAAESGTTLVADFLPCSPWQDELLAAVRARRDFKEIGKFTFRKAGRSMYLFVHAAFHGISPVDGLGALEGPFPKEHLGFLRWGYGPASKMKVKADTDGTYQLYWNARSEFQGQLVTVKVDGQEVGKTDIPGSSSTFTEGGIPLNLKAGEHEVEIDYVHWHTPETAARPLAVLFAELQLRSPQQAAAAH